MIKADTKKEHYPCTGCGRYSTCETNSFVCDDWRDWFRIGYRDACAVMMRGIRAREFRRKQKEYMRMLYLGETGSWGT